MPEAVTGCFGYYDRRPAIDYYFLNDCRGPGYVDIWITCLTAPNDYEPRLRKRRTVWIPSGTTVDLSLSCTSTYPYLFLATRYLS